MLLVEHEVDEARRHAAQQRWRQNGAELLVVAIVVIIFIVVVVGTQGRSGKPATGAIMIIVPLASPLV